jgi:hypothetical protein
MSPDQGDLRQVPSCRPGASTVGRREGQRVQRDADQVVVSLGDDDHLIDPEHPFRVAMLKQ